MKQWYLISYDVRDIKRLSRIHYHLSKLAIPIQNSVFIFNEDKVELQKIKKCVAKYCRDKQDDVHLYPIKNPESI